MADDSERAWVAWLPADSHSVDASIESFLSEGEVVTLKGEEMVDVPLWGKVGLIFDDADDFVQYGAPPELAAELGRWSKAWESGPHDAELDNWAVSLVRRLNAQFEYRYQFVYKP